MTNEKVGLPPTHPGEILREDVLPALGRSVTEIAGALGVSRQTLHAILRCERPVTPGMALRLAKLTRTKARFWLSLQANYDLKVEGAELAEELGRIPELDAAA